MKRLAEMQNDGPVHRHTIVLADDEADYHLQAEVILHTGSGWTVAICDDQRIVCVKNGVVRSIWVEHYDPMRP